VKGQAMTDTGIWYPLINRQLCTGCGGCVEQCPTGALGRHDDKAVLIYPDLCTYCAACEDICPVNAIELPYLIVRCEKQERNNYE
jgi:NAD-dependent dihydropyrimidine dehydrogenase PreA subunit